MPATADDPCATAARPFHGGQCACDDCMSYDLTLRSQPKPGAKPDELALWQALEQGEWPRHAGHRLGIPPNRVEYLCNKWARQGIYDYGVVHDLGWINR